MTRMGQVVLAGVSGSRRRLKRWKSYAIERHRLTRHMLWEHTASSDEGHHERRRLIPIKYPSSVSPHARYKLGSDVGLLRAPN